MHITKQYNSFEVPTGYTGVCRWPAGVIRCLHLGQNFHQAISRDGLLDCRLPQAHGKGLTLARKIGRICLQRVVQGNVFTVVDKSKIEEAIDIPIVH